MNGRRQLLAALGLGGASALTGCLGELGDSGESESSPTGADDGTSRASTTTPTETLSPTDSRGEPSTDSRAGAPTDSPTTTPTVSPTPSPTESPTPTDSPTPTASPTSTPDLARPARSRIVASDGDERDLFGGAVAVSADGTTALVGAHGDDSRHTEDTGAAYVFRREGGTWRETAKLTPGDEGSDETEGSGDGTSPTPTPTPAAGDQSGGAFGFSVALSADGSIALVGAPEEDDFSEAAVGAVYVYADVGGEWRERRKLTPEDGEAGDRLGVAVALSDDGATGLVGAWGEDDLAARSAGATYVVPLDGVTETPTPTDTPPADETGTPTPTVAADRRPDRSITRLTASDGDSRDLFGGAVALSGDGSVALVGARRDEDPNGGTAGSAYVFRRVDGEWREQRKLAASDGDGGELFGLSVALSTDGTTALVGAPRQEDPNGPSSGAAYVYRRVSGTWREQTKLAASDGDDDDEFGVVALSPDGSRALVGAPGDEDPNGFGGGSAYLFDAAGGEWRERAKLAPTGASGVQLGVSVALSDRSVALVGALDGANASGTDSGAAYVFRTDGGR